MFAINGSFKKAILADDIDIKKGQMVTGFNLVGKLVIRMSPVKK